MIYFGTKKTIQIRLFFISNPRIIFMSPIVICQAPQSVSSVLVSLVSSVKPSQASSNAIEARQTVFGGDVRPCQ